ncbi:hypothetical protein T11_10217 [Trichinella zimbabwensis]|uniref:G-protein coupled receptors family 1 profile domain-containing protein n=1 Tax=Trichinella zimbabwensis TaxID=268475 RepID=A0A0V1HDC7_9BILA|nr:hypothetical protein T11_10217 [Trichinella zimbabwensis]
MDQGNNSPTVQENINSSKQSLIATAIGILSIIINMFILATFRKIANKPKQIWLIFGLCCAVMIRSMATIISASRQMVVAWVGVYKIAGWKCLAQGLHLICYEVGDCTSTAFIFIISLDRFLAMTSFERYKKFTIRHVQILIGVVFTMAFVYYCILAVLIGTIYLSKREVSANCYRGEVLTLLYCKVLISTLLFIFIVTVVLYTIACLVMRCRKVVGSNSVRRNQLKREKVVTKRVAVIIVSTLITHIIPVSFCAINMWRNQNLLGISSFLLLMHPATLTLDLFLYALLDKDIRRSFSKCVACGRRQRPVCKLHDRTTNCVTPFNIHHNNDDNQAAQSPPMQFSSCNADNNNNNN